MKLGLPVFALATTLLAGPLAAQASAPAEPGTAAGGAPSSATRLRLEVSLQAKELRVIDGDSVVATYPVAVGQPGHPTPTGQYSIERVIWNPRWVPPEAGWAKGARARGPGEEGNPMGKVKLFFAAPDYYIHGTENEESLGRAASHGCIRMANADVVEVARLVMERGGEGRPPDWFHRILNRLRSTKEVRLERPATLVVMP